MSFRAIDIAGLIAAPAPADQPMPILQWVDLADLVIDTRYQRELGSRNRKAIQQIADGFDWMQFSPVLVAPAEGGRFAVIDGQHRVHAAALCGQTRVPAQIVIASAAQQARAFVGVNATTVRMTMHQVYRAALTAREGWAERCLSVVESAGCTLAISNPSSKDRKPRVIYQIGTIRKMIVERQMASAVRFVLAGLVGYDTSGRVGLYTDYIVRPMVEAVHGAPDLMQMDMVGFCNSIDPFRVMDRCAKMRADGQAVTYSMAMRAAMCGFKAAA